ncbi:MAG: SH3 domain-containing protein [Syntrophotaleaceae bacterium]
MNNDRLLALLGKYGQFDCCGGRFASKANKLLSGCLLLLVAGCGPPATAPLGEIADLLVYSQNALHYIDAAAADQPLLEQARQQAAAEKFLINYFRPWDRSLKANPADQVFAPLQDLHERTLYQGNLLPYGEEKKRSLVELCDRTRYPSMDLRAVTLRDTDLRALPTQEPGFADPRQAGEGYPFDYFQYSAIPANTPVRIHHRSADRAWYLIETPHVTGWLPALDVAPVDDKFVERFRTGRYVTVLRDNVALLDTGGNFRRNASIGALLPLSPSVSSGNRRVLIGVADSGGRGIVVEAELPGESAALWPLPATQENMAGLMNQMMGKPYGWGGIAGNRDCSSTLQDLFAAFGIDLPRNSAWQMRKGATVSLEGMSPERKEELLLARGKPFLTLVGLPGHVMLYIGRQDDRAIVFHTKWGIRTVSANGKGRHLIGKTVITSLQPGRELPDIDRPEGDLLERVDAIAFPARDKNPEKIAESILP